MNTVSNLAIVFVAQTFAILDAKGVYCEPDNTFLHGHVLWHLFVSVGVLFYGVHMSKIIRFRENRL